jgi:8-oxo-dGTP pyrophosphatase MutT (NUDIX family)
MAQKYRIYINDNTLLLTDKMPKISNNIQLIDNEVFDFLTFYKKLKKESKDYVLVNKNPKNILKSIKNKLMLIKAAGGLVKNVNGDFLFIYRNKKWDLPKGKVEKGEKLKITAVREVEEECGVKILNRSGLICKTYHVYEMGANLVLKRTNWYKMEVKGSPKLIPQKEEGITSAVWVNPLKIKSKIKNTYPLIVDVIHQANLL